MWGTWERMQYENRGDGEFYPERVEQCNHPVRIRDARDAQGNPLGTEYDEHGNVLDGNEEVE